MGLTRTPDVLYWAFLGLIEPLWVLLCICPRTDGRTDGLTYITTYWAAFAAKKAYSKVFHIIEPSWPIISLRFGKMFGPISLETLSE